jgi:phosphoribosyl 1,2-cyclic phosphate phosphodiesterase
MEITFLGTGTSQGVPVIACDCQVCNSNDERDKRFRTSLLIQTKNTSVVIDTGPDFRLQMLKASVKSLDAVIYTHEHRDHIAGLDDIRAFNFKQKAAMDIFAEERVIRALKHEFPYIFAEHKYPGVPSVNFHKMENHPFSINEIKIIPIRAMHYRLPVLGYRIADFAYITDANFISEEEKEKLIGVKYFAINALRREKHISHFTLSEAIDLINELSPKRAYLTHISHQMGLYSELIKELPPHIIPAYDGLSFSL